MLRKLFPVLMLMAVLALIAACAPAPTPAPTVAPPTAAPQPAATTAATQAPAATVVPPTAAPKALETKKILIGFTASQTGAQNVASKKQNEGLTLWLEDVKKAGGIKTKDAIYMPELKFYDDESKTDRVQALYTKLITEDKMDFLISPYSSGLVKVAAVVSEQNDKLMITAGGADDATMEQGFKNVYQVYTPGSQYYKGAIDLLVKLDPTIKKLAIIYEKDSFTTSVVNGLQPYAKSKGFDVVMFEGYDTGTTDFAPFINKIASNNPDVILGGGHIPDGTTLAKQLYEKKVSVKFLGLLVAPPEPTFADIGEAAVGVLGPSQWEPQVSFTADSAKAMSLAFYGPVGKDFTAAYKVRFGDDPSYHSAGGYAAGLMLQKAIEDSGGVDIAKMKAALDKTDVITFYGHIKFSTDAQTHGKQVGHDMVSMQWQKDAAGKLVKQIVWPLEAKTADAVFRK